MNTSILDTALARLLSTNAAVVLTEPPNSQMVGKCEVILNQVVAVVVGLRHCPP